MLLPIAFTPTQWFAVLAGLVVVNVVPLFMPPTWALLAWLHVQEGLPVWGLAATGAIATTIGRGTLAIISRQIGPRVLPNRWRSNIQAVVDLLMSRRALRFSSLAMFAWGPVSSNWLFIGAGISGIPLLPPLVIYAIARFISYLIVVPVTRTTVDSFSDLVDPGTDRGWLPALQLAGIIAILIIMRYDWSKALGRLMPHTGETGERDEREALD
jgi:membrane protein YqaA with SNARE-associated domain